MAEPPGRLRRRSTPLAAGTSSSRGSPRRRAGSALVPFIGDYITVAAQGSTIGAVWTDQRDTVGAADPKGDNDGADVAGAPETGGTCTSSFNTCFDGTGGLDQDIFSAMITP